MGAVARSKIRNRPATREHPPLTGNLDQLIPPQSRPRMSPRRNQSSRYLCRQKRNRARIQPIQFPSHRQRTQIQPIQFLSRQKRIQIRIQSIPPPNRQKRNRNQTSRQASPPAAPRVPAKEANRRGKIMQAKNLATRLEAKEATARPNHSKFSSDAGRCWWELPVKVNGPTIWSFNRVWANPIDENKMSP